MKPLVIMVIGPTATGKTALSVAVAKVLQGEVISADSMQIYKEMNIGSAKPDIEEMQGIPHHLLDFVPPEANYTVAQFQAQAKDCMKDIMHRGKQPIVAGGTGLYIHSLLYDVDFSAATGDTAYRAELQTIADQQGADALYELLEQGDKATAAELHPHDTKRVMRALEILHLTGIPKSQQQQNWQQRNTDYTFCVLGLTMERSLLYKRINARVDKMFNQGLIEEVEALKAKGLTPAHQSMQGIGYKEILRALNGEYSMEEAKDKIKQESRRYAKRQLTWFRREKCIHWLDRTVKDEQEILKEALDIIHACAGE